MITYSTNWMGPINTKWYKDRNLELWSYAAGRIDCRGGGLGPYGDEIGVPPMLNEDWFRLSEWLDTFKTNTLWTFSQLINEYEKTHPTITWANDESTNI